MLFGNQGLLFNQWNTETFYHLVSVNGFVYLNQNLCNITRDSKKKVVSWFQLQERKNDKHTGHKNNSFLFLFIVAQTMEEKAVAPPLFNGGQFLF